MHLGKRTDNLCDLSLLARSSGKRCGCKWLGNVKSRHLGSYPRRPAHVRLTNHIDRPLSNHCICIRVDLIDDFVLVGRNLNVWAGTNTRRTKRKLDSNRSLKALCSLDDYFEIHRSISHQGSLGLHYFKVIRKCIDHCHGEFLYLSTVVDGVVRNSENKVGIVFKLPFDSCLFIRVLRFKCDQFSADRRIGSRFKNDWHLRKRGIHRLRHHRDPRRQLAGIKKNLSCKICSCGVHEDGITIAARYKNCLSSLRVTINSWN